MVLTDGGGTQLPPASTKITDSSLMDSPGHIKVSFYVFFCIDFIFCIACESCLFVITNS